MESYNKVDSFASKFGKAFQKHHVLQDAVMDGVAEYTRGMALAIPLMGGSWLKGSPHYLANVTQAAMKVQPALPLAEASLKAAGCKAEDVQSIMRAIKRQARQEGWTLP